MAPAAAAFSALISKVQVPRWISAMLPAGKPAKSPASQPLVDVLPSPSWMSTGGDRGGDVTRLGLRRGAEVGALGVGDRVGAGLLELGRSDLLEGEERRSSWRVTS